MESQNQTQGIAAIKKTKNAEESAKRFFQTTYQIISHFKRDADKKLVYQLSSQENSLTNLLIASSAVHCYHNLGIRTQDSDSMLSDIESTSKLEKMEKKDLFNELGTIIGESIHYELELSKHALKYEEEILDALLEGKDIYNEEFLYHLRDKIELHLVKSLNNYPYMHYFDHIGYLTGYLFDVKDDILEEAAELKKTTFNLEEDLVNEKKGDQYVELNTASRLLNKMKKDFEFSSIKDLQMETFPFRKILNEIISYRFNLYPISQRGLESYRAATRLKSDIYDKFIEANKQKITYNEFEMKMSAFIASKLRDYAYKGPNEFVYFIQNVLEKDFDEIYSLLQRYGVYDVPTFCEIQNFNRNSFLKAAKFLHLTKMDFKKIYKKNGIFQKVEQKLNQMKKQQICLSQRSLFEMLELQKSYEIDYIKDACKQAQVDFEELQELYIKKVKIEEKLIPKFPIEWSQGYIMLFDMSYIYQNLAKFIYYVFFSRICTQIARVLESYIKLKEDNQLFLLAVKKILDTSEENAWVKVKIEELVIKRLMNRQEELAAVFDGENKPFLVNGFMIARIFNTTLEMGMKELKDNPSPLYQDELDISLPDNWVSPKSYIIAYDIVQRLLDHQEMRRIEKEQKKEEAKKKLEKKKDEFRKARELRTLNWIEKKIVSSVMSVTTNINPTQLYWSEKDQKIAIEKIKQHSELSDRKICAECGKDCTDRSCDTHPDAIIDANPFYLFTQFYSFSLQQMKKLWPRLRIPDYEEIKYDVLDWMNNEMGRRLRKEIEPNDSLEIIEGERIGVAKEMAQIIGEYLDKIIYKKFKKTLKAKK